MSFRQYKSKGVLPLHISQNFITSKKTISRILRLTTIGINDFVIEAGAGKGHITSELLKKCKKLSAIEFDKKLYDNLLAKFQAAKNLHLINMDFLKYKLPKAGDYKVFSNIPFNLTTSIVRKLTDWYNPPVECWLFMQKGAAKRFMGAPCDNIYSKRLKAKFDMNIAYYLRRDDFHPVPNVDVVLFHFKLKRKQEDCH